ncbi:MAG: glycosyltransferase family 2 protein [Pseudomonadota bacterium]
MTNTHTWATGAREDESGGARGGARGGESGEVSSVRLAVIIPYYQKEVGFLRRALQSVASQSVLNAGCELDVFIVDDHSPACPATELETFDCPVGLRVRLLKTRRNGGPAAARNLGLDSVAEDTDFVAFLDSDEVWTSNHLENAVRALDGRLRDIYFSNYLRSDWKSDKFAITGFGDGHEVLDGDRGLFLFTGCPLEDILIKATVRIQTCVVRWKSLRQLRFKESLLIGEDAEYVASAILEHDSLLCFSRGIETIEEQVGINVSQNRGGDAEKERQVRLRMLKYQVYLRREMSLPKTLNARVLEALQEARYNALRAALAPGSVGSRVGAFVRATTIDLGFPAYVLRKALDSLLNWQKKTLSL